MNALPFLPFTRPSVDEQTIAEVGDVLRSGWITTGPRCAELESALSARLGGRPVRLVNSGTASLELALRLCGIGPGDEVITTPLSWVATANVVLAVGATPVFVDVDAATRNIDLAQVEAAITPRTRALMPVDLAGLPVDRDRLYDIARRHKLRVVEDAAQSFGSQWHGQAIGSFGDLTSFSFHANKNFTTSEGRLPRSQQCGRGTALRKAPPARRDAFAGRHHGRGSLGRQSQHDGRGRRHRTGPVTHLR